MAYEFKIQIKGISKPPVWRKLKVPETFSFDQFHMVIQNAFGWYNCHLYEFSEHGYSSNFSIQIPHEDSEENEMDSRKTDLKKYFKKVGDRMTYIYDFGDDWTHQIVLENITREKSSEPGCIGGKGKCPPEDIGGIYGYYSFLQMTENPKHPEYQETMEWVGLEEDEKWDPNDFDLEEADEMVKSDDY